MKNEMNKKKKGKDFLFDEFEKFFTLSESGKLYKFILKAVEKPLIELALKKSNGNKIKAAKILGINRNTLSYKIKNLRIEAAKFKEE
ncbi:MAG: helix-turn-helix domain-containing protein [Candidatus Omnitrophota bacterium]